MGACRRPRCAADQRAAGKRAAPWPVTAWRAVDRESGIAAIQSVVLYPVLLLLIMTAVQAALYFHAENVAQSVANGALQAARIDGGTDRAGYDEADARLERMSGALKSANVQVNRSATAVQVTVSGTVQALVPGLALPVKQTATGPLERFTTRGQP